MTQLFTAEQVQVHMENGLAPIGTGVEHQPVPGFGQPFLLGNGPTGKHELTEQPRLVLGKIDGIGVMNPRNDQDVSARLRMQIPERERVITLVNDGRRQFPGNDPAEQALEAHARRLMPPEPRIYVHSTGHTPTTTTNQRHNMRQGRRPRAAARELRVAGQSELLVQAKSNQRWVVRSSHRGGFGGLGPPK
nr:hypothetical protein [Kibdelosporangium sp. MJ126-NF4]